MGSVVERSTRFSIVEHALADVDERLEELAPGPETERLRALARALGVETALWEAHPPDEPTRVALLTRVLDLNIEIIRAGGGAPSVELSEDDFEEDDYPKSL